MVEAVVDWVTYSPSTLVSFYLGLAGTGFTTGVYWKAFKMMAHSATSA